MDQAQQTHFNYLVIGTGLRQSLLAAALAKSGHSVLHVDEQSYYGEDQATLSLNELVAWSKIRNEKNEGSVDLFFSGSGSAELPSELAKSARRYNITLSPTIYPSIGPFVTSLVRSGVAKYSAFRLIDTVALYEDGSFRPAATTKEDIFKDKTLSLIEKRRIMKFVMAANADDDGAEPADEADIPLDQTLEQKYSLTGRLKEMIMYAAALSLSDQGSTRPAISRLRKYMRSTGKYGKSPFLLGQYGGLGEIVQGFCRVSAVFGGTYMLGRPIQSLSEETPESPASITFGEDEIYTADCIIKVDDTSENSPQYKLHRAIIILSRPVCLHKFVPETIEEEDTHTETSVCENALFILPPGRLGDNCPTEAVVALMAGEGSFSAPSGQYVLYLSALSDRHSSLSARQCLEPCLMALMQASSEACSADDILVSAFYTDKTARPLMTSRGGSSHSSALVPDVTAQAGIAEVCDTAVQEASACYTYITGTSDLFEQREEETDEIEDL